MAHFLKYFLNKTKNNRYSFISGVVHILIFSFISCLGYCKYSFFINVNELFFWSIKNFKNFTSKWILVKPSFLQHFLNISKLSKIKFSFSVKSFVIGFQVYNLTFKVFCIRGRAISLGFLWNSNSRGLLSLRSWFTGISLPSYDSWLPRISLFLFWWRSNFVSAHNIKYLVTFSSLESIIWFSAIVKIKISFEPLAKL